VDLNEIFVFAKVIQTGTFMQNEPQGLLRITAPVEFIGMGDIAARFMERHPRVEFDIELTGRTVDLVEEGFDMAIRAGNLKDSSLRMRKLGESVFWLCAAPGYVECHGSPRTIDELGEHECILFGATRRMRVPWAHP